MIYIAVLGRQPEISLAELEALFSGVKKISEKLAIFESDKKPEITRLGGSLKIAELMAEKPLDYLRKAPEGKITLGVSDYSHKASKKTATIEALKLKKILVRHGRSVRVTENKDAALSTATSLHNGLAGFNDRKFELIKVDDDWYRVIGVQDIDAYSRRDQARPARDAKVGMLPPKLAQVLINLCGDLPKGSRILDPFCGTGVVLQEALLMGYKAYGTDINERMIEYSDKNMKHFDFKDYEVEEGDATNYAWKGAIDAVACEGYLGKPMSTIPVDIKLKTEKQECKAIVIGFLKNLISQIKPGTPVVIAVPAWLREDGKYSRLEILDEIKDMGYNVYNKSREGLLYHREDQIVARDIIILRKD
ncbi:methyltransferase domain-containing protein [Candidatus Saccharibacteria bacterium]|nr:methyltransferase domain-containing protein [Candidatus Saccharibacteria bacterium]